MISTDERTLEAIQRRILWLAVRIVDHANHDRVSSGGLKVGGHQASSASMVSIMTALWFAHLSAEDRISVKPHGSPVLHAIQYLLGNLERRHLTTLRAFGGLQAVRRRLVTTSPDVAVSTGLAGWINSVGVFHHARTTEAEEGGLLRWAEHSKGQHIELGISEMNLFSMLGQLGDAERLHGERLLPVGTLYDPFVLRGLDAFVCALYSGARFIVAGTPSGVSLSPEGGAHQSSVTASLGLELPNVVFAEPAYVGALDWWLCAALDSLANHAEGEAFYLRLTTRELDQSPFEAAAARLGDDRLREDVLAGAYRLVEPTVDGPRVTLCASGAVMPEVVAAATALADEGVAATVVDVTSLDLLYRGYRQAVTRSLRTARRPDRGFDLARVLGADPGPLVTVHDASPHAMAFLGAAVGRPVVPLGVDTFGQSGTIPDLYDLHDLSSDLITNAAIAALDL